MSGMSAVQDATLLSAVLGALGTGSLFFGSYSFAPTEGMTMGSPEVDERNARIMAANKIRKVKQLVGLCLLFLSFAVQAVSVFLS